MITTKVIRGEQTGLSKAYNQLMDEIDMPINNWCREQDIKRKKMKL